MTQTQPRVTSVGRLRNPRSSFTRGQCRSPRTVQVKLPDTSTPAGIAEAIGSVIAVTARGRLAPSEARDLVGLLETRLKAFEVLNLEERIALLEKKDRK